MVEATELTPHEQWLTTLGTRFIEVRFLLKDRSWLAERHVDDHDTLLETIRMSCERHPARFAAWDDGTGQTLLDNMSGEARLFPTRRQQRCSQSTVGEIAERAKASLRKREVSITYLNPMTKLIEEHLLHLPTGTEARMVATRNLAQTRARRHGWRFFAIPSFVTKGGDIPERWLVFEMVGENMGADSRAVLLRDWPTRAAAEMWMQHNGL